MRKEIRMMQCLQLEWSMEQMVSNKVWDDNKSEQCIVNEITLTRDIKQIAKTKAKNVVKTTQNKALRLN